MTLTESLKWRKAIRKFDTSKKVTQTDLELLLEAGNLAPTSGGLQPFKIVVVSNEELQNKMLPLSYNQAQVKDASHVLVFAVDTHIDEGLVDRYIQRAAEVRGVEKQGLIAYSDSMKAFISTMDDSSKYNWAKSQSYISLGTVLAAAADLQIDSCPMEGFDAASFQELLGLKSKNLMPVVILPIGYRSDEDANSKAAKVRKTRQDFIVEIN